MSWRVCFLPCLHGGQMDWYIQPEATEADLQAIAKDAAWSLPLKLFTADLDDPRLKRFEEILQSDEYLMKPGDYGIYRKDLA